METKLDAMQTKLDAMEAKFDAMPAKLDAMDTKLAALDVMEAKLDDMEEKIDLLRSADQAEDEDSASAVSLGNDGNGPPGLRLPAGPQHLVGVQQKEEPPKDDWLGDPGDEGWDTYYRKPPIVLREFWGQYTESIDCKKHLLGWQKTNT